MEIQYPSRLEVARAIKLCKLVQQYYCLDYDLAKAAISQDKSREVGYYKKIILFILSKSMSNEKLMMIFQVSDVNYMTRYIKRRIYWDKVLREDINNLKILFYGL